ncbi:SET domain-containing protein [Candidatus Woesearchaeota archaeon]|nr:SET domain-containing protein [Candidatus Woesearchaeota archaeon]
MDAITSYRSPKAEVRDISEIAGKGIFAKEEIKKDEIIAIKNGYFLTKREFNKLDSECKQYCLQIEDNFYLGPKSKDEINENGIFINHSCEPNVGFRGQITYVAMRDIEPDEELTHDYAMCFTDLEHFSDLECKCGSKDCRHKLKNDDWQSEELQEKYGNYFSEFILRKIN